MLNFGSFPIACLVDPRELIFAPTIDDQLFSSSQIFSSGPGTRPNLSVRDEALYEILAKEKVADLCSALDGLSLEMAFSWTEFCYVDLRARPSEVTDPDGDLNTVFLFCPLDITNWVRPYSVSEYCTALREAFSPERWEGAVEVTVGDVVGEVVEDFGFTLTYPIGRASGSLGDLLGQIDDLLAPRLAAVEHELTTKVRLDSLVTFFSFPQEIRAPCEQYLSYFSQFLLDLGIEASTELAQRARGALFTVSPASGREALEKIRAALDTFLAIPGSQEVSISHATDSNIAAQQLIATVFHLRGQLALANATIQLKEAEVLHVREALKYRELAGAGRGRPAQTDREEVVKGIFSVTPIEGKGLHLDLPELLRRLKRKLR